MIRGATKGNGCQPTLAPASLPRGRGAYQVDGRDGPVHVDDVIPVEPGELVYIEVSIRRVGAGTIVHPFVLQEPTSVLRIFSHVLERDDETENDSDE